MIQKYSRYKILELFFKCPKKIFHIREISRLSKLAAPSVRIHLDELIKENLVLKLKEGLYGGYKADINKNFKLLKQQNTVLILNLGCVKYIEDEIMPKSIVLYGSASIGEDDEESDIDLFIESKEIDLDLSKFEKILNRKIHLFFKENFKDLSKELKNNIINGIVLSGFLEGY